MSRLRRRLRFLYARAEGRLIADADQLAVQPVQVCTRACGFSERALVHLAAVQRFARANPVGVVNWASNNCPRCSSELARICEAATCQAYILDAADSHCRTCGRPYDWALTRDRRHGRGVTQAWERAARSIGSFNTTTAWALSGDIAALKVGAVVSTDDPQGSMRGDAAHAIRLVAGVEVEDESKSMGSMFKPGEAWRTDPGSLDVDHIIHVAAVDVNNKTNAAIVLAATASALAKAEDLEVQSLGLPAIGAGTGRLDVAVSGQQMAVAVREHFADRTSSTLEHIVFVLFGETALAEFLEGVAPIFDPPETV